MSSKQKNPDTPDAPAEGKPGPGGEHRTPTEKAKTGSEDQATVEEFDREGLGVAPKE